VQHGTGTYQPTTAAIQLAIASLVQIVSGTAADASALGLDDDIFVNKEQ
jgi:hypothetical protein